MKKGTLLVMLVSFVAMGTAVAAGPKGDVFKGKLFPPNIILEHQDELGLDREQFTAIKKTVVEMQTNMAEHEWDVREAYQGVMAELDKKPIDEGKTLAQVTAVLLAENQVKKQQMTMLIRLRNLLTEEQIAYLESL